jgi:PAS domain-containing protein
MEQIVSCLIIDKQEYILSILSNIFLSDLKYNSNTLDCFTYVVKNIEHNIFFDTYQNFDILESLNMLEKPYPIILIDSEMIGESNLNSFIEKFSSSNKNTYLVFFYSNDLDNNVIKSILQNNKITTNIFLMEKTLDILPQKNLLYLLFEKIKYHELLQIRLKKEEDIILKKTEELKKIIHSLILSRENLKKEIFNEKKTEKMLEDELRLLKTSVQSSEDAIAITDEQGFIYFSNKRLEKMLELSKNIEPNTHIDDLVFLFNKDGKRINVSDYIIQDDFDDLFDIEMLVSGESIPAKKAFVTINKAINNDKEVIGVSILLKENKNTKSIVSENIQQDTSVHKDEIKILSTDLLIKSSIEIILSALNYKYKIESRLELLNIKDNDVLIVDTDLIPDDINLYSSFRSILCTSNENLQNKYSDYGFIGLLNKPFGMENLKQVLDNLPST